MDVAAKPATVTGEFDQAGRSERAESRSHDPLEIDELEFLPVLDSQVENLGSIRPATTLRNSYTAADFTGSTGESPAVHGQSHTHDREMRDVISAESGWMGTWDEGTLSTGLQSDSVAPIREGVLPECGESPLALSGAMQIPEPANDLLSLASLGDSADYASQSLETPKLEDGDVDPHIANTPASGTLGDLPIENRIDFLLEKAKTVGFDTFDEMVTIYYTTSSNDNNLDQNDSWLSRSRRLPQVLSSSYYAAQGWNEWERRGFQVELLRGAEETLMEEIRTFRQSASLSTLLDASLKSDLSDVQSRREEELMQQARKNMPHLWAFIFSLTARNPTIAPAQRVGAVYRIIIALCGSIDVPALK
ncbi:hypothetical protein M409DRAFT_31149 [Zasmidium cellare ATCC 36951]|uniref:Uncharacterized protein n=1 Tax=Zasmidium cellare ATCC 36951 TaxID=1080233 RepID=A0A6A6BXP2_ZASCE|nr:uncharacterized protein M409DRAFT_31149 [Zasmidium cellare ATCC 36951]KAF2158322.1 hypothetical protein M409DRAFT_31149 [Zasmidium cellare ATCC 36951]